MQDRFKFRAVDMKTKEIIYIDNYYWFEENGITEIDNNNTASGHTGEYWINQSTGLKDKNGKLIYEGDILCSPSWWWGPCFVYLDIGECGPCRGDSVMSYILARNINEPLKEAVYNIWNGAEVEVIGNIYEDSHLIENSNNLC